MSSSSQQWEIKDASQRQCCLNWSSGSEAREVCSWRKGSSQLSSCKGLVTQSPRFGKLEVVGCSQSGEQCCRRCWGLREREKGEIIPLAVAFLVQAL